jgi:hypothetical protein
MRRCSTPAAFQRPLPRAPRVDADPPALGRGEEDPLALRQLLERRHHLGPPPRRLLAVHGQAACDGDGVRVTTAFSRLLRMDGVWVRKVGFAPGRVVVEVALRRRRLVWPLCDYSTGRAATRGQSTRSGAILIWGPAGSRSTLAGAGCVARSTACAPRASRSPVTVRSSRATSSSSWRG